MRPSSRGCVASTQRRSIAAAASGVLSGASKGRRGVGQLSPCPAAAMAEKPPAIASTPPPVGSPILRPAGGLAIAPKEVIGIHRSATTSKTAASPSSMTGADALLHLAGDALASGEPESFAVGLERHIRGFEQEAAPPRELIQQLKAAEEQYRELIVGGGGVRPFSGRAAEEESTAGPAPRNITGQQQQQQQQQQQSRAEEDGEEEDSWSITTSMAPFELRGDLGGSGRRRPVISGKPTSSTSFQGDRTLNKWHGTLREEDFPPPRVMAKTANEGRPGYHAVNATEYMDQPEVLTAKLQAAAGLLRRGKANVIYSGAGLSTSSGMGDYASKANPESVAPHRRSSVGGSVNRLELTPTAGHHVCAAFERKKLVHHWVQQNHDRLAQKAGYPQEKLNEIHGAWGDNKNPVLAMNDNLRSDLLAWLAEWGEKVEVCLALGTSLCGMNADQIVQRACDRGGLVIVGLQPTPYDSECAVRIWGLLDPVLLELAKVLKIGKMPNPDCARAGTAWVQKHPQCKYATPVRKTPGC